MEHVLHALVLVAFVAAAARDVAEKRLRWSVAALAALAVAVRYESLFAIGFVFLFLCARKSFRAAARLAAFAALPVFAFGVWSKLHGGSFLPTSVLLKGRPIEIRSATDAVDLFGGDVLHHLSQEAHLFALGIAAAWLAWWSAKNRGMWAPRTIALAASLGALIAHIELAGLGWFYRYDSYLVILLVTIVGIAIGTEAPRTTFARMRTASYGLAIAAGVVTFGPMLPRVIGAAKVTPSAGANIFEQQVQTARFLERYFPHEIVAINDIGAVTFYRDGPIVDLVGLADARVAKAKRFKLDEPMSRADLVRFTSDARVAIVYDEWFKGLLPPTWFRVARWTIPNNVSCAFASISIYATKGDAIASVASAAREYETSSLPKDVDVEGYAADGGVGIDARDVIEIDSRGEIEATTVTDDGHARTPRVDVRVRGLDEAGAARAIETATRATATVRLVAKHAPRVCATGAVRRSACIDDRAPTLAAVLADADAIGDANGAWVLRRADDAFVRVDRGDLGDLRDGDVVIVP